MLIGTIGGAMTHTCSTKSHALPKTYQTKMMIGTDATMIYHLTMTTDLIQIMAITITEIRHIAEKTTTHTVKISGNTNDDTEAYTIKTTDHLVKPLEQMPKPGYKQGLQASCVFAGLAFSYQLLKGKEINEGVFLLLYLQTKDSQINIKAEKKNDLKTILN